MGVVYIVLKGGLGNQLFQAALGVALTQRFGVEVRYLTDYFKVDDYRRPLLLPRFPGLPLVQAPIEEAASAPVFLERDTPPDAIPGILSRHPVVVFDGHWQGEPYFFGQDTAIKAALSFEPAADLKAIGDGLQAEGAIAVHVRRSEYGQMGLAKIAYYKAAIAQIRRERGERRAICFGDEPNFCAAVFHDTPGFVVTTGILADPLNDFYLIGQCTDFVIANSSFAWWAAWLNETAETIVYAPAPWCLLDASDPIPGRWRRVDGAVQAQ
jgi:hypothetical protein